MTSISKIYYRYEILEIEERKRVKFKIMSLYFSLLNLWRVQLNLHDHQL